MAPSQENTETPCMIVGVLIEIRTTHLTNSRREERARVSQGYGAKVAIGGFTLTRFF
jgi:hypothetical protein